VKISLDGKSTEARDIDHAKEIIKEYEAAIFAENLVISHYIVDGVEVADIDAFLAAKDSHEIQNIVIVARTPKELLRDAIVTFLDYLPGLQGGLVAAKDKLTIGEPVQEGNWLLLLDGLEWTNQLLQGIKGLIEMDSATLEEIASRWQEQLSEMLSAWENGDTVFLADILEYEILEVLEELQSYFQIYLSQGEEH
jgi:hypothetical protein